MIANHSNNAVIRSISYCSLFFALFVAIRAIYYKLELRYKDQR